VCVKIVADFKEYLLLEVVAIQNAKDRVVLFIQYLYLDENRPETRKRTWADLCEAKRGRGAIEDFFDLGFATTIKPRDFHGLCILLYP